MPGIDVFSRDAFNVFSLTAAINKAPYQPGLLGQMGLFTARPVRNTTVAVEDRQGTLALIHTAGRGSLEDVRQRPSRTIRDFRVPHVPYFQTVLADDVQDVRAFGSEGNELESMADVINQNLMEMRADHEVTHEYHRIGAVQGLVKDADGSTTIYDYFTEFGITENEVDINLATETNVKGKVSTILRTMADALGATPFNQPIAFCGNTYFDALVNNGSVKDGYERWQSSLFFRTTQIGPEYGPAMNGFDFGGITWVNYRGKIGDVDFFPANEARIVPRGVANLFLEIVAPADFEETVNTMGQKLYAKQERMKFGKGVELHTQSNVLYMCTRPAALIKSTNQ